MDNILDQTLASIVKANHQSASVFERYNIDFCCKGKRILKEVCLAGNIPAEQLIQELEAVTDEKDNSTIANLSLAEIADHIVTSHHQYVREQVPVLFAFLQKIANKHGERHPELITINQLFREVAEELYSHMVKEENVLFPLIKKLENGNTEEHYPIHIIVSVMEDDHDKVGNLMGEIKKLTANYQAPADACTTFRVSYQTLNDFEKDLHQHIHLENNVLFPGAVELAKELAK